MDKGILGLSIQEWHTSQKLGRDGGGGVLVHSKIVSEMVEARIDLGRKVKLFILPF